MGEIFLWRSGAKCAEYLGASSEDEKKMCWNIVSLGDPLPALKDWKAPLLTQYLGEEGKKQRKPNFCGIWGRTGIYRQYRYNNSLWSSIVSRSNYCI